MIELQPNTLYTDIDNNRKIRLLYCMARNRSEGERVVYVIRADGGATMPYEEAYETFVDVVDKYYNAHTKYNYRGCYQELLNRFYRNEDGSYAPAYPTYEQFYYHARKIVDPESRIGKKKYAQNYRGLPGRGANALIGPGSLAQMDSTILDCTLVLPGPGRKVIGRPTLYIMVDVYCIIREGLEGVLVTKGAGPYFRYASVDEAVWNK